jgi:hypothetical protein
MSARALRPFVVLGFACTHDALDAEAALKSGGVDTVPIPAPKAIGSLCGIALRVLPEHHDAARSCLAKAGITVAATCEIQDV